MKASRMGSMGLVSRRADFERRWMTVACAIVMGRR